MKFVHEKSLYNFFKQVEKELFDVRNSHEVVYLSVGTERETESSEVKNIELLDAYSRKGGVYLISIIESSVWKPIYLGQTKSTYSRQRLRNHLFKKDKRTGSVLERIKELPLSTKVSISFIQIEPEILRHAVEEYLIKQKTEILSWNRQGR